MEIRSFSEIDLAAAKGVLTDLDNTLYAYDRCNEYASDQVWQQVKAWYGVEAKLFSNLLAEAKNHVKYNNIGQASSHSRILYFQYVLEKLTGKTQFQQTVALEKLYWDCFFQKMTLKEGVLDFLEKCVAKRLKVVVVTDLTCTLQLQKIAHLQLESYIDFIVSSEEAGIEKPHPYMFLMALRKAGLTAEEVIYLGDSYEKDYKGATSLGIRSYLLK